MVAASDTFRAGAIEQLRGHTNKLNLKLVAQNYGSDPAAVAHDALLYARSHKVDCALIDSAGRMQTNKNLMKRTLSDSRQAREQDFMTKLSLARHWARDSVWRGGSVQWCQGVQWCSGTAPAATQRRRAALIRLASPHCLERFFLSLFRCTLTLIADPASGVIAL